MIGSAAQDTLDTVLSKVDAELAKLFEDRNIFLIQGGQITFTGSSIVTTENLKIELEQKISGAVPQTIDLGAGPFAFASSGDMLVAVIDRTAGTATVSVITTGNPLPAVTSTNQEVFLIAKRVDAGDSTKRVYFRDGTAIDEGQTVRLGGASSGGGSGAAATIDWGDLFHTLDQAENNALTTRHVNQIIDTFNAEFGTWTNLSATSGGAALDAGQTSGTYERILNTSSTSTQATGVITARIQEFACKNSGITGNVIIYSGDLTPYFSASAPGNKAIFFAVSTNDDSSRNTKHLMTSGDKLAILTISTIFYNVGTDETTITFNNPSLYDLTLGLAGGTLNTYHRIQPFDYSFQTKSKAAGSLEDLDIVDAVCSQTVGIPGQNFFIKNASLTGSVSLLLGAVSPNGQYAVVKLAEQTAATTWSWHWFYSKDYMQTWIHFGTTKSTTASAGFVEEANGSAQYFRMPPMVANNGKMISTYATLTSANIDVRGVYSDLSAGSPSLTDTVVTGNDTLNTSGATPGVIFALPGTASVYEIGQAADLTDLSFIAIGGMRSATTTSYVRTYTNGGATHNWLSSASLAHALLTDPLGICINGSAPNHRVTVFPKNGTTSILYTYYNEGSNILVGSGTSFTGNAHVCGCSNLGNKAYIYISDAATKMQYVSVDLSTQTYSAAKVLNNINLVDFFQGWSASAAGNEYISFFNKIAIDPVDSNHVFFVEDMIQTNANGTRQSFLYEVCSDINFIGSMTQQLAGSTAQVFRNTSTVSELAQTFLTTATRFRSFGLKMYQVGTIPVGSALTAEIQATTGGVPNGTVIATSTNSLDPSRLTIGVGGQWFWFNFNVTLSNSTTYAFVLKGTESIDAANYVVVLKSTASSYASGGLTTYNGSVWSAASATDDILFDVNGEFITLLGEGKDNISQGTGYDDQESQINLIPGTSTLQYLTKRTPILTLDTYRPIAGHPFRRAIAIGSGGTQSTYTASQIAGYAPANYDPDLIFTTMLGNTDCAQIADVTTGVKSSANIGEDRSGSCLSMNYTNIVSGDYHSDDSDFVGSYLWTTEAGNKRIIVDETPDLPALWDISVAGAPLICEVEFKPTAWGTGNLYLFSHFRAESSTSYYGWFTWVDNVTNKLNFRCGSGAIGTPSGYTTTTTTETLTLGQYYRLRFTWDGTYGRFYYNTSKIGGTWTQFTYDLLAPATTVYQISTAGLGVGCTTDETSVAGKAPNNYGDIKIGYIKVSRALDFTYDGYKNQAPLVHLRPMGPQVLVETKLGTNDTVNGINYDQWGMISATPNNISMVDSYDKYLMFNRAISLANQGTQPDIKLTMNRVGNTNQAQFNGMIFRFKK